MNAYELEICCEFFVFVSKVAVRQGWKPPTREVVAQKIEELGGTDMAFKINSIYDLGVLEGEERGEERGERKCLRNMLKQRLTLRFPGIAQSTIGALLSITDDDLLKNRFLTSLVLPIRWIVFKETFAQ